MHPMCIFVLFAFTLPNCFAIECYVCSSLNSEACLQPTQHQVPMKRCDSAQFKNTSDEAGRIERGFRKLFEVDAVQGPQLAANCLKQVTKVGGATYTLRGCQLATADKLDICVKVNKYKSDSIKTEYCSLCNSNGCNSADWHQKFNRFGIVFTILICLFST